MDEYHINFALNDSVLQLSDGVTGACSVKGVLGDSEYSIRPKGLFSILSDSALCVPEVVHS